MATYTNPVRRNFARIIYNEVKALRERGCQDDFITRRLATLGVQHYGTHTGQQQIWKEEMHLKVKGRSMPKPPVLKGQYALFGLKLKFNPAAVNGPNAMFQ